MPADLANRISNVFGMTFAPQPVRMSPAPLTILSMRAFGSAKAMIESAFPQALPSPPAEITTY